MREKVLLLLKSLSVCNRGLSNYELCKLLSFEEENELESFIQTELGSLIDILDEQWRIKSEDLKRFFRLNLVPEDQEVSIHQLIVKSYKVTLDYSMPLLDEKVHHLYKAKDYSGLKQFLSDIEHFLLFYTPYYKLTLFKYWSLLEQAGFEPVAEYVRSLEGYEARAGLSSLDLLKVILQLSRFFKELADFESDATPELLHPQILNKHTMRGERPEPKKPWAEITATSADPFGRYVPTQVDGCSVDSILCKAKNKAPGTWALTISKANKLQQTLETAAPLTIWLRLEFRLNFKG
jgi:hypothetical protein